MGSPTRSPTHDDVPPATLAKLGLELDEIFEETGAPVEHAAIVELATDRGKPVSHYYAAAVLASDVELATRHDVALVFCAGVCQRWGALDCIDRAAEHVERGAKLDIAVRQCLDRCEHAAVCEVRTRDGTSVITQASPAKIDEVLSSIV